MRRKQSLQSSVRCPAPDDVTGPFRSLILDQNAAMQLSHFCRSCLTQYSRLGNGPFSGPAKLCFGVCQISCFESSHLSVWKLNHDVFSERQSYDLAGRLNNP